MLWARSVGVAVQSLIVVGEEMTGLTVRFCPSWDMFSSRQHTSSRRARGPSAGAVLGRVFELADGSVLMVHLG